MPLAEHLAALGYAVKGSTTSRHRTDELSSVGAQPFVIDIENLSKDALGFLNSTVLIVAVPSQTASSFQELLLRIEQSTIEKVVLVSSTSVYSNSNQVITEDTEIAPSSPLSAIEDLFRNNQAIDTTVIRFGGLVGYDRHPSRFFSPGRKIPNPDSFVNMIHRDDCIRIIEQIIVQGVWGEVFNCCADSHPTKRDFYTKFASEIGVDPPVFDETGGSEYKIISNAKLKARLNFRFKYPDLMALGLD
jgi:nucleoside-diphosphate-sugar epimerase